MPEDEDVAGARTRRASPVVPRATYRLQLGPDLTFADVGALAPYLASIGVSHVYLSPILQAVSGSAHGYDVVDHGAISDALGGAAGHDAMTAQLRAHGIGQVVDVVPNHMALETSQNRWWRDVLRNGPASRFAPAFDVVWRDDAGGRPRVVLPLLTEHYGELVRDGRIRLEVEDGDIVVRVGADALPVEPSSLAPLHRALAARLHEPAFAVVADVLAQLPTPPSEERSPASDRECAMRGVTRIVEALLEDPAARHAMQSVIDAINTDPDALDAFLEQQHYRLVPWRVARHELDHRRFFDVTGLVGLRMERPSVFSHTHRRLLELVRAGAVDGLRIDHIDGLRHPGRYLDALAEHAPGAWTVVEKILVPGEVLPPWPVAGTTGYEVLHDIQRVLVPADADAALGTLAAELTGDARDFDTVALEAKRDVLRELLAPELERVVDLALAAARTTLDWRDVTRRDLEVAITEVLCAMPVYRTYLAESHDEREVALAHEVVRRARQEAGDGPDAPDPLAFDAVRALLEDATDEHAAAFVARVEQLSGALMAKGVEDTAFYRFHRFTAACEVGGDPAVLSLDPSEFHARNVAALASHPHRMVTTSTHDTKRSEDVRARLQVLAERPDLWGDQVRAWSARDDERPATGALDRPTRYLLHQTMVGAHPLTRDRLHAYLVKATREAKVHTTWLEPELVYEATLAAAVDELFDDAEHLASLEAFVRTIEPAARANSLAQVVLRCTVPGVPDLYQGNEDLRYRLVDPDNRAPVDVAALEARPLRRPDDVCDPEAKRWVTSRCLAVRGSLPDAFATGAYEVIDAHGPRADHVLAFARGTSVVVAVTRLSSRVEDWAATTLRVPEGRWRDALGVVEHRAGPAGVRASELFARLPVVLLVRADADGTDADGAGAIGAPAARS